MIKSLKFILKGHTYYIPNCKYVPSHLVFPEFQLGLEKPRSVKGLIIMFWYSIFLKL